MNFMEGDGEQFANPGASAPPPHNTYQEEEISSSQSSDVSLESTIPCLEPWAGVHNFEAKIELGVNFNKKGAYNQKLNKLYCFNKVPILFNFHTSCDRSLMKQMNVKAMLVFSDSAYRTVPVERCITCLSQEATSEKKVLADLDENSIHQHVLQCHHEQAVYEKSSVQKRFSVTVPLERPQMGSSIVSRNFEFKCLNTCEGVKRRALSLVFLLLHNQKPVGRSVINLKVCACPKRERIPEDEKLDLLDVAAKQRCVSPLTVAVAGLNIKTEPGTSHGRGGGGGGHTSSRCERKVLVEATDESEQESFSQCSQGTLLKKVTDLTDAVKTFQDASKSSNPRDQTFAKICLELAEVILKDGEFYRTYMNPGPSSSAKLEGGTAAGSGKEDNNSPLTVAGLNIKTEPGTSHGRGGGGGGYTSSRCERKVLLEATDESEQESFSQCSQGTLVKKVADTVKMFQDASKSPNPRDQTFAKIGLERIKAFLKNGEFYRTYMNPGPSSSATDESEQESFSQCSQGTLLKKVADAVKMFQDSSKSPNPRDQTFAKNSLGLLKVFLKIGEFYRNYQI